MAPDALRAGGPSGFQEFVDDVLVVLDPFGDLGIWGTYVRDGNVLNGNGRGRRKPLETGSLIRAASRATSHDGLWMSSVDHSPRGPGRVTEADKLYARPHFAD